MGDTQKTMTISAMSFRGCNRFSPSLIYITDIWILYNGRIRQYGVIVGEQLLGYPPKGIPNFPFERNRHFVQIDVGSWFWDSFFYFQGEISSALPKTNMKPWRSFLLRKAAICPSDSSTNPWPPLITRKKKKVTVSNPEKLTKKKNTQRVTRKEQFFFSVEAWGFEGGHTVFPPQNYDVISLTIHVRYILPTFG